MEEIDPIETARSKTYQLIGRNVVLFQDYELLLKALLPRTNLTITTPTATDSPPKSNLEMGRKAVEGSTLGNLVSNYIRNVLDLGVPEPREEPDEINFLITLRLHFNDPADRKAKEESLLKLVADRNHLFHQLLVQKTFSTAEDWLSLHPELEDLAKRVSSEIKAVRAHFKAIHLSSSASKNPEVMREFLLGPHREMLVEQLHSSASRSTDPDGWTGLKDAIHEEPLLASLKIPELLESCELNTLTALIETIGGFELQHKTLRKGLTRTLYRPYRKPDNNPAC